MDEREMDVMDAGMELWEEGAKPGAGPGLERDGVGEEEGWAEGPQRREADGGQVVPEGGWEEPKGAGQEADGLSAALAEGERLLDAQLGMISRLDPDIRDFGDLMRMECFEEFDRLARQGVDLVTAYKATSYDRVARRSAAAGRQAALNSIAGRRHHAPLPMAAAADEGAEIPADTLHIWEEMFPGESRAQLRRRYNEAVRG